MIKLRHFASASGLALALCLSLTPISPLQAQSVVFDPSNYAQNIMTAAHTLQQINNQITALQNQARSLLNQAKNLANLPYSSLQAVQQSLTQTQQLLQQAQRERKLTVADMDAPPLPGRNPIALRQHERLVNTITSQCLPRRQQHIAPRQPDAGGSSIFSHRRVGESQRVLDVAAAGQDDGFGGQQFRVARELIQGFVGPDIGLVAPIQFEEHAHLGRPGGGVVGIEFQDFGVGAQGFLKIRLFEGRLRLALVKGLVLDDGLRLGRGLFPGLAAEFQVDESAHQV